jgi:isoleucyl-tRNA synthetase
MRFSWDEMSNRQRDLNILWNVFRFPLPYMQLDGFDPEVGTLNDAALETVDKWVLSRLQTVTAEMTEHWDAFRQDRALEALLEFIVEDVSRFYIQVVRERMWEEEESASKQAAYSTFYRVLTELTALLAPYAPFISETIYGTLTGEAGHETVHMCDWPESDATLHDPELEGDIAVLRGVEEAGANARQQAERKLRWPVTRVVVAADDDEVAAAVDRRRELLCDRLNAREIELVEPGQEWGELAYSARADMSVLGPEFGSEAAPVMNALNDVSITERSLDTLEAAVVDSLGRDIELTEEMVEFVTRTPEGVEGTTFGVDGDDRGVVYVDTALTEDIEAEGYAREVIRRIQEMRKELELELEAEVQVSLDIADGRVTELVSRHEDLITTEVRARELELDGAATPEMHREAWDVEGIEMAIGVAPVAAEQASD